MEAQNNTGRIRAINGPVISASHMIAFEEHEMVEVGDDHRLGEIISLESQGRAEAQAIIQLYEPSDGLQVDEPVFPTGHPLSVKLGPGLLSHIFDGIARPLRAIESAYGDFMPIGAQTETLDAEKTWPIHFVAKEGDQLEGGAVFATTQESDLIENRIMVPPTLSGTLTQVKEDGRYALEEVLAVLVDEAGHSHALKMYQEWPVRQPRPVRQRLAPTEPLATGQRVLDVFFPIAKGGTVAIPGGFGTGKTTLQHQIAKFCDAQIIIYIGCGERGNEMTDVLDNFPKLIDPNSGKNLMERTVLIANTSNMPVMAREASIYTGITMAEYYRDMGYHVALMADSTSRWAEALREISGRLEEMPAEEGYPAYLASRIAQFYERAGLCQTLGKQQGSVTLIGAVSPAGGDFSEPVTESTKRYVKVFLGLDKSLAYARHYPAVNWITSYSSYTESLRNHFLDELDVDVMALRARLLDLLMDEAKLKDIVALVGADVLPDSQRLVLAITEIVRVGFLQQNPFTEDRYNPMPVQVKMLEVIETLYQKARQALKWGAPLKEAADQTLFHRVSQMKYDLKNNRPEDLAELESQIERYYDGLENRYQKEEA